MFHSQCFSSQKKIAISTVLVRKRIGGDRRPRLDARINVATRRRLTVRRVTSSRCVFTIATHTAPRGRAQRSRVYAHPRVQHTPRRLSVRSGRNTRLAPTRRRVTHTLAARAPLVRIPLRSRRRGGHDLAFSSPRRSPYRRCSAPLPWSTWIYAVNPNPLSPPIVTRVDRYRMPSGIRKHVTRRAQTRVGRTCADVHGVSGLAARFGALELSAPRDLSRRGGRGTPANSRSCRRERTAPVLVRSSVNRDDGIRRRARNPNLAW